MPSSPATRNARLAGSGTGEGLPTLKVSGKSTDWPGANEKSSAPNTLILPKAGRLVERIILSKVPGATLNGKSAEVGDVRFSEPTAEVSPLRMPDISAESGVVDVRSSARSKVPTSPEQAVVMEAQVTVPVIEA